MYDKVYKGTFLGGNLTTALHNKTGNGGAVIWGGIRDIEQMNKVPQVQVYYRGIDPVSYTHLDVYKRQHRCRNLQPGRRY